MDWYHAFLKRVAHFQVAHPVITLLLLGALTLTIMGGLASVQTVASLEQMMPPSVDEIKAFHTLRDQGMGQDILAVILRVDREAPLNVARDVRGDEMTAYLNALEARLQEETDVLATYSYASVPLAQRDTFINNDATVTMLLIRTDVAADDLRMSLLAHQVEDIVAAQPPPAGYRAELTGTPIIQRSLGELITRDRTSTRWISTLLVFIITALIFASLSSALVPIIIVTISVTWLYGTMGYTGLPISTLAGGVAAMVIGIGIDFAIHIMNKFKYERKRGKHISEAVELAVVETGTALTATSITTIAAFLAFLIGAMPEMGRFGMLMAIGIGYALIFSIVGLPALLILEERFLYSLKKWFRFGIDKEFRITGGRP